MVRLAALTVTFSAALALTGAGAAHGARCTVPGSLRSGLPAVSRISTTNVGCDVGRDVARGIVRRYDDGRPIAADLGTPQPTFTVRAVRSHWRGHFTCRGRYVELNREGDLAYELRCAQGRRVIMVRLYS